MFTEELFNRVGVPLVDSQSLLHYPPLIQQFDDRISTTCVPDGQTLELLGQIAFHEGCKRTGRRRIEEKRKNMSLQLVLLTYFKKL